MNIELENILCDDLFIDYLKNSDIPYFSDWFNIAINDDTSTQRQELLDYYKEYKEND